LTGRRTGKQWDVYSERSNLKMKFKIHFVAIPFERFQDYVKVQKITVSIHYPMLCSSASMSIEEPCFIIKTLRILALKSTELRNIELCYNFSNLLSGHYPKNIFKNMDRILNSNYLEDTDHFYITILPLKNLHNSISLKELLSEECLPEDPQTEEKYSVGSAQEKERIEELIVKRTESAKPKLRISEFSRAIDDSLGLIRISLKLRNSVEKDGGQQDFFRVTGNTEGYLNTTFQKNIKSERKSVTELESVPQEKVKEKLMINDWMANNTLEGMHNCKEDVVAFIQSLDGIGKCFVKVSLFFTRMNYKSKFVHLERENLRAFEEDRVLNQINHTHFYEEICQRVRMLIVTSDTFDNVSNTFGNIHFERQKSNRSIFMPQPEFRERAMSRQYEKPGKKKKANNNPVSNMMSSFDSRPSESYDLFHKDEILLLNLTVRPMTFKHKESKLIMNSHDINQIFNIKEFCFHLFKTDNAKQILYLLDSSNPKMFFIGLMRYIVSRLVNIKSHLYKNLSIREFTNGHTFTLRNTFSKYEHNRNIMISNFLEKVSDNLVIVYTGVNRSNDSYMIVNVYLNSKIDLFHIRMYSPKVCRTFQIDVPAKELERYSEIYFPKVFLALFDPRIKTSFKDYSAFCEVITFSADDLDPSQENSETSRNLRDANIHEPDLIGNRNDFQKQSITHLNQIL
jgi:hypothetical protein